MKKGSAQVIFVAAVAILLIIGGIFFANRSLNKPASNKTPTTPKTAGNNSASQLPQGNGDAVLDQSMKSINSDLNQLDSDNVSSSQGLNDQQIDVNQ